MKKKWGLFFLLYLGGVTVSLSQLKITPIQTEIHNYWHLSYSQISWFMSIFTVTGIFLALPGGSLVRKIGDKKTLLFLMLCTFFGNLLGYFVMNYWLLVLSRIIEGISFSLIIMLGIVFIDQWFENSHRGVATGIWSTFSAAGSLLSMNLFLPFSEKFGLKSLWLVIAFLAISLFFIYALFIPKDSKKNNSTSNDSETPFKTMVRNKPLILLALAQASMAFVLFSFINLYPMIYKDMYGITQLKSNQLTGFFGLFGIPFGAIAGYLIDRTRKGSIIAIVSFLIMFLGVVLMFNLNSYSSFLMQSFILSSGASLSSSCIMTLAPSFIKNKNLISTGISIINLFYYIAIVIGTPLVSTLVSSFGTWTIALSLLAFISLLGTLCIFILNKKFN